MARNRRADFILATLAATVALGGCTDSASTRPVSLPTRNASESATSMAASLEGTLEGDAATGCVWVAGDSQEEQRVTVRWPRGYSVEFTPLRLFDAAGQEVAREGQHIQVAGGFINEGDLADCPSTSGVFHGSRPEISFP